MWRSVQNFLAHALSAEPKGWHPLLAVFYLTYACDFHCPFCSDGSQTPYPKLRSPILRKDDLLTLLGHIRRYSDYLVLTGGEPLRHPDFSWLMQRLPGCGFDGVILTTIGDKIHRHLQDVDRAIRYLVFSLETLDEARADAWYGRGPGMAAAILANIERARRLPGRRAEIIISSVATPDNLEDLFAVYAYARERGFRFAVCPQLLGVKPHPDLFDNPVYRRLFDFLIAEKKRGGPVNGTLAYLTAMRDLRKFACRPSTVLAVSPAAEVFYPCLEKGQLAGSLLDEPDLHALRRRGMEKFGPEPECPTQCHSACALGFASLFERPWSLLSEAALMARRGMGSVGR